MRVFDSNVVIYHLNDVLPDDALSKVKSWIVEGAYISVITRIEVLGFRQSKKDIQSAERLLSLFGEVPLHEAIVQRTIRLRQAHAIKIPDAIIAASALDRDVPLVTRNTADFGQIEGVTLVNPFGD
jgi:predicted nucleic acid-binding protein